MNKLACVVLAAGEGTRMKSDYPKVVHKVGGKPLIGHVLETVRALDPEMIALIVGHGADLVRETAGEGVRFVEQGEQQGTGHAVLQSESMLSDYRGDIMILSGDVPLLRADTLRRLLRTHREEKNDCTLLTASVKDPSGYGRVVRRANGRIQKIVEEKDATLFEKAIEEINSGTYCFGADALFGALKKISPDNRQKELYLTDTAGILAAEGKKLGAAETADMNEIAGINSRIELARVEKLMQQRIQRNLMLSGVTIVDPDTTHIEATVSIGRDSIIHPFTVIEGEVRIGEKCEIGPFSHIRTRTVLEEGAEVGNFVEVKSSTIGAHTKAKHLSYLGDTTIGRNANIGAGSITANYDGKKKHRTEIGDGAFIGSGTIVVAPVRVGAKAVTGAGAVVLKGRDVPDGSVFVGVPAEPLEKKKMKEQEGKAGLE